MLQVGAGRKARSSASQADPAQGSSQDGVGDRSSAAGGPGLRRGESDLEAFGDVFYEWDLATDRLKLAGRGGRLFGIESAAELPALGSVFGAWVHPEDRSRRLSALAQHLEQGATYDCQYRLCGNEDAFRWVHDCGTAIAPAEGGPAKLFGSLRLVSVGGQRVQDLARQVLYDPATGLFQRQPLHQALDRVFAAGERAGWSSAVAVLRIESGLVVPPEAARPTGAVDEGAPTDLLLQEMGRCLDRHLRGGDIVGRLAGDRFGILLGRCDEAAAHQTLERVVRILRQNPEFAGRAGPAAEISAGYVLVPAQARSGLDALARAEAALTRARRREGGGVVLYHSLAARRQNHAQAVRAAQAVDAALADDRLSLAFQPVVQAETGAPGFFECLLRRRERDGSLVPASDFIAQVEPLGIMPRLDRQVLNLTLSRLESRPEVVLALNISALTVADPGWLSALADRLAGQTDLGTRLIVEITETASLQDLDEAAQFVRRLHGLGVRVAIDDFGAGSTSVRHLTALDADFVKIDAGFSAGIRDHPQKQDFLRRLIELAARQNLATVAEGVENAEDAAFLRAEGFGFLQGYYFGRPSFFPDFPSM